MKTPRIAAIYRKADYWNDIETNFRQSGGNPEWGGSCLPPWAHDFISVHAPLDVSRYGPNPTYTDGTPYYPGYSLMSPMKLVEHPSCRRPQWEDWHFADKRDAIVAAKWIARQAEVWIVDCTE